jgi:hypothetical protein
MTPPDHCLLHPDHTASSLLLIQTSTQSRLMNYVYFIPALTSPLPATALSTLNTLTLQLPSAVEKEAKAKKGITKLLLFHICGKLSNDSTCFGNLSHLKSAQGMRVVLDSA